MLVCAHASSTFHSLSLACARLSAAYALAITLSLREIERESIRLSLAVSVCVCVLLALIRALGFHANLGKLPRARTHTRGLGATVLGQLLHFLCPLKKKALL